MEAGQPGADPSAERYNPFTGKRIVPNLHDAVPAAALLGLEPPRFCEQCGRRMVVQVSPDGWWAKCSRHGVVDSTSLEQHR
ncbi:biotin synthase auxiliary protein BsaP [Nocardia thraciensis]